MNKLFYLLLFSYFSVSLYGDVYIKVSTMPKNLSYKIIENLNQYHLKGIKVPYNNLMRIYAGPFKTEKEAKISLDIINQNISFGAYITKNKQVIKDIENKYSKKNIYIHVSSVSLEKSSKLILDKLKKHMMSAIKTKYKKFQRIYAGPFSSNDEANTSLKIIKKHVDNSAYIVTDKLIIEEVNISRNRFVLEADRKSVV